MTLAPGAVIGVVGGGQLGLYFVLAARQAGYVTWVLDPDSSSPAGAVAHQHLVAAFDDESALNRLASACEAITLEFENVPAESFQRLESHCRVVPSAATVRVAQDRLEEKRAAAAAGLSPVPHARLDPDDELPAAIAVTGLPAILKTSRLGYDGLGQRRCSDLDSLKAARESLGAVPLVLEKRLDLQAELSVVLARSIDGSMQCFPPSQNVHINGILARSMVPSGLDPALERRATEQAIALAESLDYRGVLAVEFFVDDNADLWFNEMAPRPHNSGHYTLDATDVSQFDQQLRALCGLALVSPRLHSAACMLNLLGERWEGGVPAFDRVLDIDGACLHLYGKVESRAGRKMGHITCIAETADTAVLKADQVESKLRPPE